jgi:hypothetical protein
VTKFTGSSGQPGQILELYPCGTTVHFTKTAIYEEGINISRERTTVLEDFQRFTDNRTKDVL